jgi:hypothetical protein
MMLNQKGLLSLDALQKPVRWGGSKNSGILSHRLRIFEEIDKE